LYGSPRIATNVVVIPSTTRLLPIGFTQTCSIEYWRSVATVQSLSGTCINGGGVVGGTYVYPVDVGGVVVVGEIGVGNAVAEVVFDGNAVAVFWFVVGKVGWVVLVNEEVRGVVEVAAVEAGTVELAVVDVVVPGDLHPHNEDTIASKAPCPRVTPRRCRTCLLENLLTLMNHFLSVFSFSFISNP
jgi:hypothetical protein